MVASLIPKPPTTSHICLPSIICMVLNHWTLHSSPLQWSLPLYFCAGVYSVPGIPLCLWRSVCSKTASQETPSLHSESTLFVFWRHTCKFCLHTYIVGLHIVTVSQTVYTCCNTNCITGLKLTLYIASISDHHLTYTFATCTLTVLFIFRLDGLWIGFLQTL